MELGGGDPRVVLIGGTGWLRPVYGVDRWNRMVETRGGADWWVVGRRWLDAGGQMDGDNANLVESSGGGNFLVNNIVT